GRGNVAIAVGARLGDAAGAVGVGHAAALLLVFITGLVGAALVLVVAGLVIGGGIFRVGGLDLRFGFGEFVMEFDVRLVALVLIVLVVFCRSFSAFVLARILAASTFARTRTLAARVLAGAGPALALAAAGARGVTLALALAVAVSILCVRLAGALIFSGPAVVALLSGLVGLLHRFLDALLFLFGRQLGIFQCVGRFANLGRQRRIIGTGRCSGDLLGDRAQLGGLGIFGRRRAYQSQCRKHHRERDHTRKNRGALERLADFKSEFPANVKADEQRDGAPPQNREQRRAPRPAALRRRRIGQRGERHDLLIAIQAVVELRGGRNKVVGVPIRAKCHDQSHGQYHNTRADQRLAEHSAALGRQPVSQLRPGHVANRLEQHSQRNRGERWRNRAQHHTDCC